MTLLTAGTEVPYSITYLEMESAPDYGWPQLPFGKTASLLKSDEPPVWWFLALYDAVGRDYAWEDIHSWEHDAIAKWLGQDAMSIYTLFDKGWPQGFFMLEDQPEGVTELAYFGLVPEAVGSGLGKWLLQTAIRTGWDRPNTRKLTVQTCTLDHPRALSLYQKCGFTPVRREDKTRTLTRDIDTTRIPD